MTEFPSSPCFILSIFPSRFSTKLVTLRVLKEREAFPAEKENVEKKRERAFSLSTFQSRLSQEFIYSTENFLHKSSTSSDRKQMRCVLVVVEGETHALKNPSIDMFLGAQVRLEHQSDTHRIPTLWSRVHWRAECILRNYKESNEKGWKQDWR